MRFGSEVVATQAQGGPECSAPNTSRSESTVRYFITVSNTHMIGNWESADCKVARLQHESIRWAERYVELAFGAMTIHRVADRDHPVRRVGLI